MERQKRATSAELEELTNAQSGQGINMAELQKAKRMLEAQLEELRTQMDELEDDLQLTEDAKLRLEVNLQAAKTQYERDISTREEASEEKRKGLLRQLRDVEGDLEEGKCSQFVRVGSQLKNLGDHKVLRNSSNSLFLFRT